MTPTDSQAARLHEELARVLALLEKTSRGEWSVLPDNGEFVITSDGRPFVATVHSGKFDDTTEANAQSIAAAINFLRKHGAHIAETFKETPNG